MIRNQRQHSVGLPVDVSRDLVARLQRFLRPAAPAEIVRAHPFEPPGVEAALCVRDDVGRPYYRARTDLDVLAVLETEPGAEPQTTFLLTGFASTYLLYWVLLTSDLSAPV